MTPSRRRHAALLAVVTALAALLASGLAGSPASAAPTSALIADRTSGLLDGSAVTLTGTGREPGSAVQVAQCRRGDYPVGASMYANVTVGDHTLNRLNADCNPDLPNSKIDNSGRLERGVVDRTGLLTVVSYVHAGTTASNRPDISFPNPVQVAVSFTCDETTPCTLVVIDVATFTTLQSVPITFAPRASTACGAPTAGTATGGGPFSMTPTYQRWAAASCATGTATPLLADYTDAGEANGLATFAAGQSDFAMSATGFSTRGGADVPNDRPAVFTPVAAEAAVIAYVGNSVLFDKVSLQSAPVPITDLSLTLPEVARLFADPAAAQGDKDPALLARNPQLKRITDQFGMQTALVSPDGVLSTPDATVLAMTTAWAALPSSPWTRGPLRTFPVSLGNDSVSTASIPLLSNLPALRTRVLGSVFTGPDAPAHQVFLYLTDSATAAQLGLRVAKLANARGDFVAPTAASIAAGVNAMKAGPDGVLTPDATSADPAAYPLPLVQYAVTPRQAFDAAHKAALTSYVRYATTTGQRTADLAPGVFPLTPGLVTQAADTLPLIGTQVPPVSTSATTSPAPPTTTATTPARLPTTVALPRVSTPGATAGTASPTTPAAATNPATATVAIPVFRAASQSAAGRLLPAGGVALLGLLLCGAAYVSSGRPLPAPPAALVVARGRLRALRRRR